jgi:peptide/nickel transport system substrate-binding protein
MSKHLRKLAALLAACLLLSGCGGGKNTDDGDSEIEGVSPGQVVELGSAADDVFSLNYDAEAGINPIRATSSTNMLFTSLMYDSVFTVNPDFSYSSELVTSYTTEDNVWWVFTVDTSIPFTDGSTLTARDIVYSIQRAEQSSYYSGKLNVIYGISAMSDDCFAITTKYADSALPALLNIPVIKQGSINDDVPAGTGPYKMSEDGDCLELFTANRHADEMPLDKIYLKSYTDTAEIISAFEESLLDIVTNDPTGMFNLGYGSSNETRYYDTTNMHYLGFNMTGSFFLSSLCRYAMNFAVDRDYVVDSLMSGCGVASPLPVHPNSYLYDAEYAKNFDYDLERCSALFAAANVADHDDDGKLEFLVTGIVVEINLDFIVNSDSTVKVQAARKIAEALNSIGITTTLRELSWADYVQALEDGDYDMYYGEMRLTPDWNLSPLFEEKNSLNYANCYDQNFCDLYQAYLSADDGSRYDAYQDVCHYVLESGGIVPICFEKRQMLTHRGVVTGATATQYDIFYNFRDWTIDLK